MGIVRPYNNLEHVIIIFYGAFVNMQTITTDPSSTKTSVEIDLLIISVILTNNLVLYQKESFHTNVLTMVLI